MFVKLVIGKDSDLDKIFVALGEIKMKMEQFQQAFQKVADETTRIADYIDNLQQKLQRDDLTDEEENQILQNLHAAADRLRGLGQNPEQPIPDVELPE